MGRQTGIGVGLPDGILGSGTPIVEPDQRVQGVIHVGHEDAIDDVVWRVEELVLFRFFSFTVRA
jgi:hypothetical protein